MDSQEKRLESELQTLKTEYDQTIQNIKLESSNQIDQLIKDHDSDLMVKKNIVVLNVLYVTHMYFRDLTVN